MLQPAPADLTCGYRDLMRRPIVLHPFLFAIYPVVALLAINAAWAPAGQAGRAVLASLAVSLLLLVSLTLILRDPLKAGLIASLLIVPLVGYGQLYDGLRSAGFGGVARHRYLAPVITAGVALGITATLRTRRELGPLNHALNLIAALSLALPLVSLLRFEADRLSSPSTAFAQPSVPSLSWNSPEPPPDIYLILLDAYARQDVLSTVFSYDNSPTLEALRELGFYVADESRANHAQTSLSLAALLNMDYVPALLPGADPDSVNREALWQLVQHSRVRAALEQLGYTSVAFATGLQGTEILDADVFLAPPSLQSRLSPRGLNAFESMLLEGSAGRALTDLNLALPRFLPDTDYPYQLHRERVNFAFDQLQRLPETAGPKFVIAHIIAPHPPFVFGPNGEPIGQTQPYTLGFERSRISPDEYIQGYRHQIQYVDQRLLATVTAILKNSERPPIIIVQADHGPEGKHATVSYPQQRMTILNALYLPNGGGEGLYSDITPVNTFRLILQHYFQGDIELLPDRVLYSEYRKPYDFIELTDKIK